MSRVVTSPSTRWPGSVTIADPMNLPQVELVEAGLEWPDELQEGKSVLFTVLDKPAIPALLACVEKWELANVPAELSADNFPMTPRKDSHDLIGWLFGEIRKVYFGEIEIPNE